MLATYDDMQIQRVFDRRDALRKRDRRCRERARRAAYLITGALIACALIALTYGLWSSAAVCAALALPLRLACRLIGG